jgi:small-conductance mechanosensitive channel
MDFLFVLAQQQPVAVDFADKLFEHYPPEIAVPAFVVALIVVAFLLEKVIVTVVRRITSRTETKIDDALADGLPSILRPAFFLAGLHIAVNVLLRKVKGEGSELTPTGQWVETTLSILTILILSFCLARMALRMVDAWVAAEPARVPAGPTIKFGIKLVAVPLAVVTAAEVGGAQLTGVVTALGVGSLALGLALQDTLKNIVSGMQLVLDRPIRAGDFVEIDKNARGTVIEIGLRSTKLRSPDNNTIIIPNNTIANAIVTNVDHTDRSTVETLAVSVAYGSDTRRTQAVLEEVVAQAATDLPGVLVEPMGVQLRDFGESGVNFTVRVRFTQFSGRLPLVTEVYHRIYTRLRAEGIQIPFPTRTVHLRQDAAPTAAVSAPPSP